MTEADLFARTVSAIRALVPAGQFVCDLKNPSVSADMDLLERMIGEGRPAETVRLWQRPKSLVTSRRLAQRAEFVQASRESARRGWPVEIRQSAGLTVAHHAGVLNIAHLVTYPDPSAAVSLSFVYDSLLALLIGACRELGIETDSGSVAGAYCDGSQNLRFGGRKLAGASARLVRRGDRTGLLSHASLTVSGEVGKDVAAVRAFEQSLGLQADYDPSAHCSLEDALASMSYPPSRSSSVPEGSGPSFRSSLGEIPNFSL